MLPYIHIGSNIIESYTLFINLGTVIGAFVMYWLLEHYCREERFRWKLVVIMLAVMIASAPLARLIKGFMLDGNGTATHFIGRVLAACVVMELVFAFFWKDSESRLQAQNAVVMYLAIQHLFNRISCYMNGCCGGKYIDSLNIRFPSQLAEAGCMVILMILIAVSLRKGKSFYYQFFMAFAVIIFISEFFIEDTRTNVAGRYPVTGVQIGALVLLVLSVSLYIFHRHRGLQKKTA